MKKRTASGAGFRSTARNGAFSRFSDYLSRSLKGGLFGKIFSSYPEPRTKSNAKFAYIENKLVFPIKKYVSRLIDTSVILSFFLWLKDQLLKCRIRAYGVFFVTFGAYSALISAIRKYVMLQDAELLSVVMPTVLLLSSLPLLGSNATLSEELCRSSVGKRIRELTGFRRESMTVNGVCGRSNVAFALGLAFGMLSFVFPSASIMLAGLIAVCCIAILCAPEIGVVLMFFLVPWISTVNIAVLVIFTSFSYAIKVIRGKRAFRFERLDAVVAIFTAVLLCGGFFSDFSDALRSSAVYVVFMTAYFLTVFTMRTDKWLKKCSIAALTSAFVIAAYATLAYFVPKFDAVPFVDYSAVLRFFDVAGNMFGDISMLLDYLVLVFPLALGIILSGKVTARQSFIFVITAMLIIACSFMYFTPGVRLALLVSLALILLIRNHHYIYFIFACVAVFAVIPAVFPDVSSFIGSVIGSQRIEASIESIHGVWSGAVAMITDFFVSGIGLGEEAWSSVFPNYYNGAAPIPSHSHSIYLQILSTLGVFGIIAFALCLFFLFQSNLTFLGRLSHEYSSERALSSQPASRQLKREYISQKTISAAPLASVTAALALGITDDIWYNYRVFLMFWLVFALSSAYSRYGTREVLRERKKTDTECSQGEAETSITLGYGE